MNTSTSLFARALASENIFVNLDTAAPTASFDMESRTLTIPDWKTSQALKDMIIAHEVGHALYTPAEEFLASLDNARERKLHPQGYKACINSIEDARIERMIKEKFPGCRRDFFEGYKEILALDIFELKDTPVSTMSIIDRINLYFKFGVFGLMSFDFSPAEQKIIDRVSTVKTYAEVVKIADDLFMLAKDEMDEKPESSPSNDLGELMDKKFMRDGKDLTDADAYSTKREDFPYMSYSLPKVDSSLCIVGFQEVIDDHAFKMERLTDNPRKNKDWISEVRTMIASTDVELTTFRKEVDKSIKELAAQFERRKAAAEIRNERMKESGNLNPDRLHQYRTHDDIFLRNLVKFEGKKHGMVFLIDWSGSMSSCADNVLRQTLLLVGFCRKVKIPYEVFLYTDCQDKTQKIPGAVETARMEAEKAEIYKKIYPNHPSRSISFGNAKDDKDSLNFVHTNLVQVLSSTMTDAEQKEMEKLLWLASGGSSNRTDYTYAINEVMPSALHMGGTPTVEAMMILHDYLPKFINKTGSQITSLIMVTDGEPNHQSISGKRSYNAVKGLRIQHMATGRIVTIPSDTRTGVDSLGLQLQYFMASEMQRMGVTTIGFSIGCMTGVGATLYTKLIRNPKKVYPSNMTRKEYADAQKAEVSDVNREYNTDNFYPALPELTPGFHEYYIVRPLRPAADVLPELTGTLTKIRNTFIKSMTNRMVSRVFLNRFANLVAGHLPKKGKR